MNKQDRNYLDGIGETEGLTTLKSTSIPLLSSNTNQQYGIFVS